jgi:hypothetical protein
MKGKDTFFTQSTCDRCGENLRVRQTSWFTNETIGLKCMAEEDALKNTMRLIGLNPDEFEGIGAEGYAKLKKEVAEKRSALSSAVV